MLNLLFVKADFLKSIEILWKGMLAMLIVIGVIIAVTYAVLYISKRVEARKASRLKSAKNPSRPVTLDECEGSRGDEHEAE